MMITLADIWFKLYYGEGPESRYMISFSDDSDETIEIEIGYVDGFLVVCEAERFPALEEPVITVQEKLDGGDWQDLEDDSVN